MYAISRRRPYSALLVLIAAVGSIADFSYMILSDTGTLVLPISPGELTRGMALLILVFLLGLRKIEVSWPILAILGAFLSVGVIYAYIGEGPIATRQEMRLLTAFKITNLVFTIALVKKVIERKELSLDTLMRLVIIWVFIFHIIPIIFTNYNVLPFKQFSYRMESHGLIFSINASSISLLASYPLMAIPETFAGIFASLGCFMACEMIGTKAAAVGGLITPIALLLFGLRYRPKFYVKSTFFIIVFSIMIFFNEDLFLGTQRLNLELYQQAYASSQDFFMTLTTGRAGYYSQLPEFIRQNNLLELLVGSHLLGFNEMDHLMLLSRFGIIGVTTYFIVVWKATIMIIRLMRSGWLQSQIAVSMLALITHSILGGHVVAGTVSSFPVAIVAAIGIYFTGGKSRLNKRSLIE
jgi:hypothetical protein